VVQKGAQSKNIVREDNEEECATWNGPSDNHSLSESFICSVSLEDRASYFSLSMRRITKEAEDNMEFLSAAVTDGVEHLLDHWGIGDS